MFDIEMPEESEGEPQPAAETPGSARRGPMASAVRENADSLRERREIEAEVRAENDALAHEYVRLKRLGLVMELVPVGRIDQDLLTRDRRGTSDVGLEDLKASIRAIGLSNPIQVERAGERYELIQGWRRLAAFRELHRETGEEQYSSIPAAVAEQGRGLEDAYRRMVDENLVRKNVSFAEMAGLARSYADDKATSAANVDEAVSHLFASASAAKRSHIRAFAELLELVGDRLSHADAISRSLGLDLRRALSHENVQRELRAALAAEPGRSSADELEILKRFASGVEASAPTEPTVAAAKRGRPRGAKTTFRFRRDSGDARCVATAGRVELRADDDFTGFDRKRLEAAVAAFFRELDQA